MNKWLSVLVAFCIILPGCQTTDVASQTGESLATEAPDSHGLIVMRSEHDVATTFDRLIEGLEANDRLMIVQTVDHSANAGKAGLELPGTRLIIFGNPDLGTVLMQAERTVAIDLPQKYLVWEDDEGVWIGWNDPRYLARRHGIDPSGITVDTISDVLRKTATVAARR